MVFGSRSLMVEIMMPLMLMQTRTRRRIQLQEAEEGSPEESHQIRRLIPIVKAEVSLRPNIPNKELKALLMDYVKDIFLTASLLQQTRAIIRKQVFGDADTNVMNVPALQR